MGTPLTGSSVASTYTGLLKSSDNSALTSVLKAVGDGSGIDSALQLSTTAVNTTGDFSVGANKLTVAAASGNTVVGGTFGVTGATNLSTLATSGATTIGGNLTVTGGVNFSGGISIPGSLTVSGISNMFGNVTMGSALSVIGNAGVGGTFGVTGNSTFQGTVGVTGATTLASVGVTGAATVGTNLDVTGATTLDSVDVTGAATVGTTLNVTGAATLSNNLTVTGNATVNGNTTIGNLGTDLLTINANEVTLPNLTNVTVDLANDKVLITDFSDSSRLKSVAANSFFSAANAPQIKQTLYQDSTAGGSAFVATSAGSGTEITVLTTTITPRSTASTVLVTITINYSCGVNFQYGVFKVSRNGTEIGSNNIGSSLYGIAPFGVTSALGSNFLSSQFIQILDSPSSASAVTYKIHFYATGATFPVMWLNRTYNDVTVGTNSSADARVSSSMILQEYFA